MFNPAFSYVLLYFDGLKDYAMKIIAMLFAECVKLAVLVMMMYYNLGLYGAMCKTVISQQDKAFGLPEMSFVIFSSIMGFALIANAPKLASTIVSGQPQMSMGEFVGAACAIGGGAFLGAKVWSTAEFPLQMFGQAAEAGARLLHQGPPMQHFLLPEPLWELSAGVEEVHVWVRLRSLQKLEGMVVKRAVLCRRKGLEHMLQRRWAEAETDQEWLLGIRLTGRIMKLYSVLQMPKQRLRMLLQKLQLLCRRLMQVRPEV